MSDQKRDSNNPVLAENRRARHDYQILSTLEAGVDLAGTEVKSCRARHIVMGDGYVAIENGEAFLYNVNIGLATVSIIRRNRSAVCCCTSVRY